MLSRSHYPERSRIPKSIDLKSDSSATQRRLMSWRSCGGKWLLVIPTVCLSVMNDGLGQKEKGGTVKKLEHQLKPCPCLPSIQHCKASCICASKEEQQQLFRNKKKKKCFCLPACRVRKQSPGQCFMLLFWKRSLASSHSPKSKISIHS